MTKNLNAPGRKINLLYVLDHESPVDLEWRKKISKHFYLLRKEGLVAERDPFSLPEDDVRRCASEAEVVLLLVSPDLLCMENTKLLDECFNLYERDGFPRIIPVIVRECNWKDVKRYANLTSLPRQSAPVAKWSDADSALASVAKDVRGVVESFGKKPRSVPFLPECGPWD